MITIYGRPDCEDTDMVRAHLQALDVAFAEVNIDDDATANQFVLFINGGFRSTPTVVMGASKRKVILTEPTEAELDVALKEL
jgi:mycoredoxin